LGSTKHDQSWRIFNRDSKDYLQVLKEFNKKVDEGQKYEFWDFLSGKMSKAYRCIFYEILEKEQFEVEKEHSIPPQSYLESLKNNCLYRFEGFWAYEFCYGKQVRQFHAEQVSATEQKVTLNYYLGYAPETEDIQETIKNSVASFSETYPGGTTCDLSNQKRSTKIIYFCDSTKDNHILSVTEPSSCLYEIIISTPLICKHPKYKKEIIEDKNPIICLEKPLSEEGIVEAPSKEDKRFSVRSMVENFQQSEKLLNKISKSVEAPWSIKIEKGKTVNGKAAASEIDIEKGDDYIGDTKIDSEDLDMAEFDGDLKVLLDNPLIDKLIRKYLKESEIEDKEVQDEENPDLELVEPEDNDLFQ